MADGLIHGGDELAHDVKKDFQRRAGQRGVWESYWDDIAELVEPNMRGVFRPGDHITPGDRRTERQLDSRPVIALTRFSAILDSLLTPRNQTWHRVVPTDRDLLKDHETRLYFDEVNRQLFRYRYAPPANFSAQNQMVFRGLGAFGSSSMFIDRLTNGGPGIRYKNVHVGETFWRENHQGIVDDVIRRFILKADQLVQVPGWRDNLPEAALRDATENPNKEYEILHRVRPRPDVDFDALDERALPFESVYVVVTGGPYTVETGGYRTMPYSPTRYEQSPNEAYGRSPAMQSYSAIKTLNVEKRIMLTQGHRAINPVLLLSDDGLMQNVNLRPGSMVPGGVNPDGRALIQTLPTGDPLLTKDMMDQEKEEINAAFLVELFQILAETPRMTATEVLERTREKGMLLAPTVGRQQSEYLGPMIEREIDVLASQGLLPDVPPALQEADGEYNVVYDSPLSKVARAEEAAGFTRTLEVILPVVNATQDASALDNFDFDVITREMADIGAVPASWMKAKEMVDVQREQRAAAQQAAMEAQNAPAMLQGVAAAKKAGVTEEDLQ